MDSITFDNFVKALPEKVKVTLIGAEMECSVVEYGTNITGNYLVLETTSPEGYNTKFSIRNMEIKEVLYKYVDRMYINISADRDRITFEAAVDDVAKLADENFGELLVRSDNGPHVIHVDTDNHDRYEVFNYLLAAYKTRKVPLGFS